MPSNREPLRRACRPTSTCSSTCNRRPAACRIRLRTRRSRLRTRRDQPRRDRPSLSPQPSDHRRTRSRGARRAHRPDHHATGSNAAGPWRYSGAGSDGTGSGHVSHPIWPYPSAVLLGAVVAKALAVTVDDAPAAQRLDFVFLLSLIGDPLALAAELTPKDRRRIRARKACSPASIGSGTNSSLTLETEHEQRCESSAADRVR